MRSQIAYNHSIWQDKYWIVKIFRKLPFRKFVPEKREEANNAMTNQQQDLLALRALWMLPNWHWRDLSLPTDCRGHGVFGPRIAGWYEQGLTLLFVGGADWVPLGGSWQVGWELTLVFVDIFNRGPLWGYIRGSTSLSPCCPNPSSLDFWFGFFLQIHHH